MWALCVCASVTVVLNTAEVFHTAGCVALTQIPAYGWESEWSRPSSCCSLPVPTIQTNATCELDFTGSQSHYVSLYQCCADQRLCREHCELSSRSGRCAAGVCKNGGSCVNLLIGGFKCDCPPGGFEKPYCEMTTRNFPPHSFLTFKGLRQRFHFTLSLTFATKEQNGLLLYNGRFNEKHDFIAMEIINEQIQLTFSAGETKTTVSPHILGGVSDGLWHVVDVHYYNKYVPTQDQHSMYPTVAHSGPSLSTGGGAGEGQRSGAGEERKEGKEMPREVLTRALYGDAALQGRPLLLLWFFQSILNTIFVLRSAVLVLHDPCHSL
ncbi:unnamed protein product [Pleuronectes platessa]|uniref:Uncharacterized protein n=1 Tax=Pleuronectes platessa TaxID=8262 RepID=A0A9N7TUD6_PLEPL|nr:unnamed protein product [Pleuronectes platessa]